MGYSSRRKTIWNTTVYQCITPHVKNNKKLIDFVRRVSKKARRVVSICNGVFILAAAGLLSGIKVTTHWAVALELSQRYPDILLDSDKIHINDGRFYSSAGVTAGIDLALFLVEQDYGRQVALAIAKNLVMFMKRQGGGFACGACPIGCVREVNIPSGKYGPVSGAGPEYETMASLGSYCLVDDLEAICKGNELCNRYGMDTISVGASIAFAMEAFEKGIITSEATGGAPSRKRLTYLGLTDFDTLGNSTA